MATSLNLTKLGRVSCRPVICRLPLRLTPHTRFASLATGPDAGPKTIVDPGFWRSLIPKPMRRREGDARALKKSKGWNPATFYIAIFVLIGSMSIQMITLRNSLNKYMRKSELKIAALKEVVERIQRGEDVDVEQALGTGDEQREADWEQVLRRIEREDAFKKSQRQAKTRPAEIRSSEAPAASPEPTSPTASGSAAATGGKGSGLGGFF